MTWGIKIFWKNGDRKCPHGQFKKHSLTSWWLMWIICEKIGGANIVAISLYRG
jgi:hypothetical protein